MSEEIKNKVSNKKKRKFKQPTLESPESPSIIQKTLSNIKQSQIPSINGQKDSSPSNKKKRLLSATEEIGKNAPNFQFKNGEKWYEEYREISEEQLPKTANNELSGEKACSSRQLDQQEILALEQQALKLLRASAESHTPCRIFDILHL